MKFDPEAVRKDFPILGRTIQGKPLIYLDNAATSQKPYQVIDQITSYYERSNANVHRSIHTLGEEATALYEAARDAVCRFTHAPRREGVIFTRGTTEAINLVASSWGRAHLREGDEILLSVLEHHSNLIPWQLLAEEKGARLVFLDIDEEGRPQLDQLDCLLTDRTRLVAVTGASNVTGTITPIRQIVEQAHAVGAVVVVDGAQRVPHLAVDVEALGCDFFAFSGHKMLGPTGIGVLYGKPELLEQMPPFMAGGEMVREVSADRATWNALPWKFEAGTPNTAGAIGLGAAIKYLDQLGMEAVRVHGQELVREAWTALSELEGVTIYGKQSEERVPLISFNCRGIHPHDLAAALDEDGIAVRAGRHCTDPLMKRLGVAGTARASFYLYNTGDEVRAFVQSVHRAIDLLS
ncbi:MAG: SufS family cysteine desulfurase [Nitrospirae bacterium]|nr:SufS family cysteine desulfurase [Candidatus Manganitrophaceae bacterium]